VKNVESNVKQDFSSQYFYLLPLQDAHTKKNRKVNDYHESCDERKFVPLEIS
jgi:hypothetical protein